MEEESASSSQTKNHLVQFFEGVFVCLPRSCCSKHAGSHALPLHCCEGEQRTSYRNCGLLLQEDHSPNCQGRPEQNKKETGKGRAALGGVAEEKKSGKNPKKNSPRGV